MFLKKSWKQPSLDSSFRCISEKLFYFSKVSSFTWIIWPNALFTNQRMFLQPIIKPSPLLSLRFNLYAQKMTECRAECQWKVGVLYTIKNDRHILRINITTELVFALVLGGCGFVPWLNPSSDLLSIFAY